MDPYISFSPLVFPLPIHFLPVKSLYSVEFMIVKMWHRFKCCFQLLNITNSTGQKHLVEIILKLKIIKGEKLLRGINTSWGYFIQIMLSFKLNYCLKLLVLLQNTSQMLASWVSPRMQSSGHRINIFIKDSSCGDSGKTSPLSNCLHSRYPPGGHGGELEKMVYKYM